ncbi:MAG TPA: hypothetical protein VH640_30975 [Bryobacteraceae bacterium]
MANTWSAWYGRTSKRSYEIPENCWKKLRQRFSMQDGERLRREKELEGFNARLPDHRLEYFAVETISGAQVALTYLSVHGGS